MTTPHKQAVEALLSVGLSERQAADRLGISRRQVRNAVGRSSEHRRLEVRPEVEALIESNMSDRPDLWASLDDDSVWLHDELYAQEHKQPVIEGVTADRSGEPDNIWQFAIEAQKVVYAKHERKQKQAITLPNEPVAIAFLSDLHIGSGGTDYAAIKADAELIRDTPGMYAGFHGDGTDNWIVGKLVALQRGQALGFDAERLLFESWVNIVGSKLLWWVEGNHDDWTEKLVGSSPNRAALQGARALYDRNQCVLSLHHSSKLRKIVIRHKWRFSSVFNPTHGLEVGWDRGDIDYDWAVGGHTHIGTFARAFYRHGRRRLAILTGTYKLIDGFGEEINFPQPKGRGCGAMVLDVDGSEIWFDELTSAAKYLGYLRGA